jgi:hypothetical protein
MFRTGTVVALFAVVLPLSASAQDVKPEWKFSEGKTFYIQATSTLKQDMTTLNKKLLQNLETTTVYSLKVVKVEASKNVVLEQKVESIKVENKTGGAPPTDEKFNQQLVGATFRVTLGPSGDVLKFEGYDDLVKKIAGDDAAAQKVVRAALSEDNLKRAAADVFSFLPDKPLKTWSRQADLNLGPLGSFATTKAYKLEGKETVEGKPVDKITFTGEAKYSGPAKVEGSPFPFQVTKGELKAEDFKGTLLFNTADGKLVSSEVSLKISGDITISVSGSTLETKVLQEQSTTTKILDQMPK